MTKDALGANAEGVFGRSAWEPTLDTAASKSFVETYKAKFGRIPSYHSAAAFAAGQVFEAAMRAAGEDRVAIREFLATKMTETVLGSFKVNAKGQQEGYHYIATQWQGGACRVIGEHSSQPIIWSKPKWA